MANWHGVNFTQGFREPAIFFLQAKDRKYLNAAQRNYRTVMDLYGQVPGGGFGADENCRRGYIDPRQGFETCSMVEFMHSFELLTKISGNPVWSDRCEEIAFNTFPAAQTPDLKALHYLTSPNMVQLDKENKSPGIQNAGTMISFSPYEVYRCCQHNVSHGWPYYCEELWLATPDRGLCASLYSASEVTAKVGGDGAAVKIVETTDYPFSDTIEFKFGTLAPVKFPLYLRNPRWCASPQVEINGRAANVKAEGLSYLVLDRTWSEGDTVRLKLPMRLAVRRWAKNHDSASIDYGPLTFSLAIGERWTRYGGTDAWPEQEVRAATPWNYGLELDARSCGGHRDRAEQNAFGEAAVHGRDGSDPAENESPADSAMATGFKRADSPAASQPGKVAGTAGNGFAHSDGRRAAANRRVSNHCQERRWNRMAIGGSAPFGFALFRARFNRGPERRHRAEPVERYFGSAVHVVGSSRHAGMGAVRFPFAAVVEFGRRLLVRRYGLG